MTGSNIRSYYEAYWQSGELKCSPPPELVGLFRRFVTAGDRCLDVGCGDGGTSGPWLTAHAESYLGVDISESAVQMATERGLDARAITDATDLPFEDGSFDLAVCSEVLEHLFEPQHAIAEIRRVLTPGGRLIATMPNVSHWRTRVDLAMLGRWNPRGDRLSPTQPWRDPHLRFFTIDTATTMFEREGYEVVDSGGFSEVGFVEYLPGLRRLARSPEPTAIGRRLGARFPWLMCGRVYVVGQVPAG